VGTGDSGPDWFPYFRAGTYVAGSGGEQCTDLVALEDGTVAVGGITSSDDFPIKDPIDESLGGYRDGFVVRLSGDLSELLSATYLGGEEKDWVAGLAAYPDGTLVGALNAENDDLPIIDGPQPIFGGLTDVYLFKLTPDASEIIYSTYFGGENVDECVAVALDRRGRIFLVGDTRSYYFPQVRALQHDLPQRKHAFAACLSVDGRRIVYSTPLSGGENTWAGDCAVTEEGALVIVGTTDVRFPPSRLPSVNQLPGHEEGRAFAAKIAPEGGRLIYCTRIGTGHAETADAVAVDAEGFAYVVGDPNAEDFPLYRPYQDEWPGST
jgi:hypothetical protein